MFLPMASCRIPETDAMLEDECAMENGCEMFGKLFVAI